MKKLIGSGEQIAVTGQPAALDLGLLPLALGGNWSLHGRSGDCAGTVASGSILGSFSARRR